MNHFQKIFLASFFLLTLTAEARQSYKIRLNRSDIKQNRIEKSGQEFVKISVNGFEVDKTVGAPALPVKSWLIAGTPKTIKTQLQIQSQVILTQAKPYPTQEQDCRCKTDTVKSFNFDKALYQQSLPQLSVHYLGAYKGSPISRVDVRLGTYDNSRNEVTLITNAEVSINADEYTLSATEMKDYLIVATPQLVEGVSEFVNWRRSQGYNVYVETLSTPMNTLEGVKALIKKYYKDKGIDFAIIVGDENAIPMFKVDTTGSYRTPSDLQYYTMDGANDHIPDILSSRIVASTAADVAAQLSKAMQFEQKSYENSTGLKRIIGIASNEGYSPSDDEYVRSIENSFKEKLNVDVLHLFQNDSVNSKPSVLNATFDSGAFWLTYLGHGSGSSWPSFYNEYSTADINLIRNATVVKPIVIDVACQNGRLVPNYLGTTFMRPESSGLLGAAAYYGGSVNISWHPPAVMARGIAFEHMAHNYRHLGQALLAGHLYLAANWNNESQVIDNFEWYHLQGDPGMNVQF